MPMCHLTSEESLWIFNLAMKWSVALKGMKWSGEKCLWLELGSRGNKPWSWEMCIIIHLTGGRPLVKRHWGAWSDILNVRWHKFGAEKQLFTFISDNCRSDLWEETAFPWCCCCCMLHCKNTNFDICHLNEDCRLLGLKNITCPDNLLS